MGRDKARATLAADHGSPVNEYSTEGAERKKAFLRDAGKYLRCVGHVLAEKHGMTEMSVRPNKGGIAVSGEVYGEFRAPGSEIGAFVEIGTSVLGGDVLGRDNRADGLVVRAVWRARPKVGRSTPEGGNTWHSPSLEAGAFADVLAKMVRVANVALDYSKKLDELQK